MPKDISIVSATNVPLNISAEGSLSASPGGSNVVIDGLKDVTTAGTAEQLATDQSCTGVLIQARYNNVGRFVAIGNSTVVATETGRRGIIIAKGQIIRLAVTNLNLIYLDVLNNGDGVTFTCFG